MHGDVDGAPSVPTRRDATRAPLLAMLFVPGSDERKLSRIPDIGADAFILDLEDAVAIAAKPRARELITRTLTRLGGEHRLWVRVNDADSGMLADDLDTVVVDGLAGVDLPKVNAPRDVHVADWLIDDLERRRGLRPGGVELMVTIETAAGVARVDQIATASKRLRVLGFGAGDFSLDIGVDWPLPGGRSSPSVVAAKTRLVIAARHAGLEPPHDGVFANYADAEGLRAEATLAREIGFLGKHVIHPAQVDVVRRVFMPSEEQLDRARRMVAAFDRSEPAGVAAVAFEGQLVDYPVVARARSLLAIVGE